MKNIVFIILICGVSFLLGCSSTPPPPQIRPITESQPLQSSTSRSIPQQEADCLEATQMFYKRAWRSIDDYLQEIKPVLKYLSALDTGHVGQRLHRAEYRAEFQEQIFQRFRLMERVTDRCEVARPHLLRYREELILQLDQFM